MNRPILAFGAVAAVAVLAVGGLGFVNRQGGIGAVPSPTPTAAPTMAPTAAPTPSPTPTPAPTPAPIVGGTLPAGTYVAHPLPAPDAALSVTFTVPDGWEAIGDQVLLPGDPGVAGPGGMGIQFVDVTSVNRDACHWKGQKDEIDVGPTVNDLVVALRQQTAMQAAAPVDVTLGGYSGKRVDVVAPTEPFATETGANAPSCDESVMQLWSTTAFGEAGIYLQGPANRWQANILDVDGTRLVVVAEDYPGTSAADRAELDAILESLVITP